MQEKIAITAITLKFNLMLKDEVDDPVSKIQVRGDGNSSPIDPQLVRAASKILKEISLKSISMLTVPVCWDYSEDSRAVFVLVYQNLPSQRETLLKLLGF